MTDITDITNDCRYKVENCYDDRILYNIQAPQISTWKTIAIMKNGVLYNNYDKGYKILFDDKILKIYRIGVMGY